MIFNGRLALTLIILVNVTYIFCLPLPHDRNFEDAIIRQLKHREKRSERKILDSIITSVKPIYHHLEWGNKSDHDVIYKLDYGRRYYEGYGDCRCRWPVSYTYHIAKSPQLRLIIQAYVEMFRLSCRSRYIRNLRRLFDKGYARLEQDHAIAYSEHNSLFIRHTLTYTDMDDLEKLIEMAAFSQTYVSWFKFPVKPLDPKGQEISDRCFIEIVARLHAIDLIMSVAIRYTDHISYYMGVRLKNVIKIMCNEYRKIKGHENNLEWKRALAQNCLSATMALFEFLYKYPEKLYDSPCAHSAFQKFFREREKLYVKKAEKYGKAPQKNLKE